MKHNLKPLKDNEEKVCSAAIICFVYVKELLKCMKCEHVYFAIIPKDSKEEVEEVPTKVLDMLGDFSNIVSDNVSNGLNPMRKISH